MIWLRLLAECAWKGSIILLVAGVAAAALRRRAASLRHLVWTVAFAALLTLPIAILALPQWGPRAAAPAPRAIPSAPVAGTAGRVPAAIPAPPPRAKTEWPAALWLAGCVASAAWFLLGAARTSRMARRARPADGWHDLPARLAGELGLRRTVRLLESGEAPMPLTWNILRPLVVLPAGAAHWPPPRLHAVLVHEFLHVRRLDVLGQAIAQAACCLYWFHPATWWALGRLRRERERACDDAVLRRGLAPHDYAAHLMDLVRAVAARRTAWSDAPAMGDVSDFESRVRALLDRGRNRAPLTRRAWLAVSLAAALLLAAVGGFNAHAQTRSRRAGGDRHGRQRCAHPEL
jgi:beta-lactamase regulating signal transducer with metallopeptidase domain